MYPAAINGTLHANGKLFKLSLPVAFTTTVMPSEYGYYLLDETLGTGTSLTILVPDGFITDFATINRAFWSLLPPIGKITFPALLHDYLYVTHPAGRKWADAVFYAAMKEAGVGFLQRWICYLGTRIGGRSAYDVRKGFEWPV